jgi:hypothetical protein
MMLFSRAFIRKLMIWLAATASVTVISFVLAGGPARTHHSGTTPIQYITDGPNHSHEEQPFLSESAAAMREMTADATIAPSGDVDRDFVAMMAPHHQGAIDVAKAELKYGHNERLRRLAQEIVAKQQQNIAVMGDAPIDGSIAFDRMNMRMSR